MSDSSEDSSSDSDAGLGPVELDDGFDDIHKLILQGFIAAGYLNFDGVKQLFKKAHEELKGEFNIGWY